MTMQGKNPWLDTMTPETLRKLGGKKEENEGESVQPAGGKVDVAAMIDNITVPVQSYGEQNKSWLRKMTELRHRINRLLFDQTDDETLRQIVHARELGVELSAADRAILVQHIKQLLKHPLDNAELLDLLSQINQLVENLQNDKQG